MSRRRGPVENKTQKSKFVFERPRRGCSSILHAYGKLLSLSRDTEYDAKRLPVTTRDEPLGSFERAKAHGSSIGRLVRDDPAQKRQKRVRVPSLGKGALASPGYQDRNSFVNS